MINLDLEKNVILNVLKEKNFDVNTLDAVVGRGGMLKPIEGGTYEVNDDYARRFKSWSIKDNMHLILGGILANEIADELGIPAFIVDPVVVDELARCS